jgi:hypothetical protein
MVTQDNPPPDTPVELPPKRQPWFFDSLSGREFTYPNTGDEVAGTLGNLAFEARKAPDWRIEGGPLSRLPIALKVVECVPRERTVIAASTSYGDAVIRAEADRSGWIRVTVDWQGRRAFTAWLDRAYEEYALWPSGAEPGPQDEEPGRIGKKLTWVGLNADAWPALSPLADAYGAVTLCEWDQEFAYVDPR